MKIPDKGMIYLWNLEQKTIVGDHSRYWVADEANQVRVGICFRILGDIEMPMDHADIALRHRLLDRLGYSAPTPPGVCFGTRPAYAVAIVRHHRAHEVPLEKPPKRHPCGLRYVTRYDHSATWMPSIPISLHQIPTYFLYSLNFLFR